MNWIIVALGGALGALSRVALYWIFSLTGKADLHFLPTLLVNVIGSFFIGFFFFFLAQHTLLSIHWRALVMTGFLGAFTTFSTFSLDCFRLLQSGLWIQAVLYSMISVVACLALTWAGYALAARIFN